MSEEKETENGLSAKKISKIFKFMVTSGIVVSSVLKWVGVLPVATISENCSLSERSSGIYKKQ